MKDLSLRERLTQLDSWARQRDLLKPNETLFARRKPDGSARIKNKSYSGTSRNDTPTGLNSAQELIWGAAGAFVLSRSLDLKNDGAARSKFRPL
jgi:hypothetical protein